MTLQRPRPVLAWSNTKPRRDWVRAAFIITQGLLVIGFWWGVAGAILFWARG